MPKSVKMPILSPISFSTTIPLGLHNISIAITLGVSIGTGMIPHKTFSNPEDIIAFKAELKALKRLTPAISRRLNNLHNALTFSNSKVNRKRVTKVTKGGELTLDLTIEQTYLMENKLYEMGAPRVYLVLGDAKIEVTKWQDIPALSAYVVQMTQLIGGE